MISQCEDCMYYGYDEEFNEYICEMDFAMDEDEYSDFVRNVKSQCPYYKRGNEYTIVNKQI
ncbi:MAG: DUF6472 family protein [Lachnospiraceae bacterium]|nr:DUF6472 family protein [Lachnospiraceae bacterium]